MTFNDSEVNAQQSHSQFERDNRLTPLGDDFEARALRAEAILNAVLPELLDISIVVPRSSAHKVKDLQTSTQKTLDQYRDDAVVKADQALKYAYPETEAYD